MERETDFGTMMSRGAFGIALALGAGLAGAGVSFTNTIPARWIEISHTGQALQLHEDETKTITTTVGNAVFPAGRVAIANNGGISFNPKVLSLSSQAELLPSNNAFGGAKALLPYWSDIGNHEGDVYWQEVDDTLIIEWYTKQFRSAYYWGFVTFQVQIPREIHNNVAAQFLYQTIEDSVANGGENAAIGYQSGRPNHPYDYDVQYSHLEPLALSDGSVLSMLVPTPGVLACGMLAGAWAARRRR